MKDKIHPKVNPVVFLDVMSGAEFIATSTLHSEETKKIDGVDHFVIRVESSSASHPFYTGNQKTATKSDQVAKFMEKVAKAQKSNQKKVKEVEPEDTTPKAVKEITATAEKNTAEKEARKAAAKATPSKKAATLKKPAAKKTVKKPAAKKK